MSGTFALEDSLPRVPLPSLDDSCARFLDWCAPLLSAEEMRRTKEAVAELAAPRGPAQAVQSALEEYAARPDVHSWLDDFWRSRYLGRRDRIALNANFFFLFKDRPTAPAGLRGDPQVAVAADTIATALAYQRALAAETVPTSMQRGTPLSMEGNKHLFSTTRIPGREIDSVRTPYTAGWPGPSREPHVVVLRHGAMFRLDVVGPEGVPHTLEELADGVRAIRDAAPARGPEVGQLTTLPRAEWAQERERLAGRNAATLDLLERALFCVCLDDAAPHSPEAACAELLAGDSGNRWFDKAMSYVVFANGTVGLNGEHCCLDGTNVIEMIDAMYAAPPADQSRDSGARPQGHPAWEPMDFELDEQLTARIHQAGEDFAAYAAGNAMMLRDYPGMGAAKVKQLGVSPDAFVQLALQLAQRRAKGITGTTYESVATRRFHHGRTEAMRVVTPQVIDFVETMSDPGASADERRAAFHAAAEAHVARARACQAGEAPEQHLWELQLFATRHGMDLPNGLYESPGWLKMRDDHLSTSAVPSTNIVAFGFGATSDHCIGLAYLLVPDEFGVYLATPRKVAEQMNAFADALADVLTELEELLS